MSLGTIKNRHEKAINDSPFARKLAARKSSEITQTNSSMLTESKIQFRTGRRRPLSTATKLNSSTDWKKTTKLDGKIQKPTSKNSVMKLQAMNGFRLGDWLECIWKYDRSYGKGHGQFVGCLEEIREDKGGKGFFFTLRDKYGVLFDQYTPMCKLKRVKNV